MQVQNSNELDPNLVMMGAEMGAKALKEAQIVADDLKVENEALKAALGVIHDRLKTTENTAIWDLRVELNAVRIYIFSLGVLGMDK